MGMVRGGGVATTYKHVGTLEVAMYDWGSERMHVLHAQRDIQR